MHERRNLIFVGDQENAPRQKIVLPGCTFPSHNGTQVCVVFLMYNVQSLHRQDAEEAVPNVAYVEIYLVPWSRPEPKHRSREGNGILDVVQSADPRHYPLDAHAIAAVLHAAVSSSV